jgi:hypothetical protein
MESCLESSHGSQFERHEIKEERAVSLSGETNQFPTRLRRSGFEYVLKVGRLPT